MVAIFPDPQKQPSVQQHNQNQEAASRQILSSLPWWRGSVPGYGFAFLIVAAFTTVTLVGERMVNVYYFPNSASLLMGILCVALFWGVGPGLFATILSCCVLFYIDLFPGGDVGSGMPYFNWEILFPVTLFAIVGIAVVILIVQRETARRKALRAEWTAQMHASELADANQELRQANQFKDLFVSITSHELKTPITTIRGQAQLALRRLKKYAMASPEMDGLREAFVKVDEQTGRLTKLLNELLDLTSLRSGKQVLAKKTCNLNAICAGIVEEQRMVSERVIELTLPEKPVMLRADEARLGQVVTNLLSNALKYSSPESVVKITLEQDQKLAHLKVQDAGQGISPEQQENIFQPFYRTSDARSSTISGTGLGLAICKDIVDQHRGRIWCESRVGEGSTFFVDLPLGNTSALSV
ncbi:MAG TPA: ATP-binding protein [Ktedonobacteraceae bacterium]